MIDTKDYPTCANGAGTATIDVMEIAFLVFLVLIGPLAVRYGADSRLENDRRR